MSSKTMCRYCNTKVLKADYNSHSGPCYTEHYTTDGVRKSLISEQNKKRKKKSSKGYKAQNYSTSGSTRHIAVEAPKHFNEDGSTGWGYAYRENGRFGSHASFDDYSEDSWS